MRRPAFRLMYSRDGHLAQASRLSGAHLGDALRLRYAVEYGDRLLMMHQGEAVLDVEGEGKKQIEIDHLLKKFNEISIECGN